MTIDIKQFEGFTPGPWRVYEASHLRVVSPLIHVISEDIQGRTADESYVNARLIAAAPPLLAEVARLQAVNAGLVSAIHDLLRESAIAANRIHNGAIDPLDAQTIVGNPQASSVIARIALAKAT